MQSTSELDRDPASEVVDDPTPASVRRALEVVARHGYLTREKLATLEDEETKAIWACIKEYNTALAVSIAKASDAGAEETYYILLDVLCGWINYHSDLETTWSLNALPEKEREAFRTQPVNPQTWKTLRSRARWHTAHPHLILVPSCRPRSALRGGPRRRSIRSGPRKTRASGSQGDDPDPLAPRASS
jgi:hypothetical protein